MFFFLADTLQRKITSTEQNVKLRIPFRREGVVLVRNLDTISSSNSCERHFFSSL